MKRKVSSGRRTSSRSESRRGKCCGLMRTRNAKLREQKAERQATLSQQGGADTPLPQGESRQRSHAVFKRKRSQCICSNGETDIQDRRWTWGRGERPRCAESNVEAHSPVCNLGSHREFAVCLRELKPALYRPGGVGRGGRWEGGSKGRGRM